jgi:hypothetical protein
LALLGSAGLPFVIYARLPKAHPATRGLCQAPLMDNRE